MATESIDKRRGRKPLGDSGLRDFFLNRFPGQAILAALSGTLLFLACADFDIWPLAWLGMVPLLWVLLDGESQPRSSRPFLIGYITGLFANGGGFYWIVGLLMRFGHLPFLAALPIFLLLIAYQALTFGVFALLISRLRRHIDLPVTLLAPLCWVACELCVPYVFPWYFSITQAWVPRVIQVADFSGPLGVSFLLVLSNGALFDLLRALPRLRGMTRGRLRRLSTPLYGAAVIALSLVYGTYRIHQVDEARAKAPKIKVGVVQANVGIHEKFVPGLREQQHLLHLKLSQELAQKGADLIMWPESSYPYPLPRPFVRDFPDNDLRKLQRGYQTPLLFGALTVERNPEGEYVPYNTALLMDKSGDITGRFDKNFLLVFGEYLPFARELAFLRELIPAISNFARGTTTTTFPFDYQGQRYFLGPMICYEDIIPAFGRRLFANPFPPNLMVNITNDAWFGATSEPYEHLALSVFRAVEHREDLIRAVNTGVSAFIDATGRVYRKGPAVDPQLTPDAPPVTLLEEAALLPPGGLYQRLGDAFGGTCFVIVLFLGLLSRRRAGVPLLLRELFLALLVMQGAVLLFGIFGGLSNLRAIYATLLHRSESSFSESALFTATWQLGVALLVGALGLGIRIGRRLGAKNESGVVPGRMELLLAGAATTVLPVVLFGRMEGNTGAVVILYGLCAAGTLLGRRIGSRLPRPRPESAA